ncbi:Copper homeostasis protein-like protein, partial [Lachnellula occidentalis]
MPHLEIASFNLLSAQTAAATGASRIELCRTPSAGGLTPLLSTFTSLKQLPTVTIPIYVMIRPHANSFTYSPAELVDMESCIKEFSEAGADGFVFGVLTPTPAAVQIDVEANKRLIRAASGKPCTFHRAFDCIPRAAMAGQLEVLVECGFAAVLSSGGARTATEGQGSEVLRDLVQAAGESIEVIVGGG